MYSANKLSVICLFVYFSLLYKTRQDFSPAHRYYSKIKYSFDLCHPYFLPNLKKSQVLFQFVNEPHEKQEVAKIVCQVRGYDQFLASLLRTCSHEKLKKFNSWYFFKSLNPRKMCLRQYLIACSCGFGLTFKSLHLVKWSKSKIVARLSQELITLLNSR